MIVKGLDILAKIELQNRWCSPSSLSASPIRFLCAVAVIVSSFHSDSTLATDYPTRDEMKLKAESTFGEPKNATRLSKDGRIWVDKQRKIVIVDGFVTLREGQLEMFACPVGTKEHESIVAVYAASQQVHAGLLAIGAKTGKPTHFEPYRPATGATIKIQVLWLDEKNQKQVRTAQHWIRNVANNKEMPYDWVFSGSILRKDPDTGEEDYLGNSGDLICVANFPTATLDIAVESMAADGGLTYAAFTERIPPQFTVVRLVLEVSDEAPKQSSGATDAKPLPITEGKASEGKPEPERADLFR